MQDIESELYVAVGNGYCRLGLVIAAEERFRLVELLLSVCLERDYLKDWVVVIEDVCGPKDLDETFGLIRVVWFVFDDSTLAAYLGYEQGRHQY